jgi:carboxyl-terminal processing protease
MRPPLSKKTLLIFAILALLPLPLLAQQLKSEPAPTSPSENPVVQEKKQAEKEPEKTEDQKKEEAQLKREKENPDELYNQLNLFGDVFERVRAQYVDEISNKKLIEYAINGMLSSLDPHSAYLNEDDFDDMRVQTKGEFGGLGIEVTMEDGLVKVVSPIDDTPAFKAGIKPGDFIVQLDQKPIMGMSLSDAVEQMRGRVGTMIELTVRREGVTEPLTFRIKRDVIKIQSVRSRMEGDDIGYLRVTTFNQNTYDGLKSAIEKLQREKGDKLIGYVLDLRNNPGGLLDQAVFVADAFLEKGEIVSTRGREKSDIKRDNATAGDLTKGLPIVVLINGGSASAAEIVAGALQDHKRAIVMGTKSFGKGSVQTVIPMPNDGAMRLTTARYYTPSGRSIQAKGIEPDILVEPARLEKLDDYAYHEADLKGALVNPEDGTKEPTPVKDGLPDKQSQEETEKNLTPEERAKKAAEEDYQLLRAKDLIRGLALYKTKD